MFHIRFRSRLPYGQKLKASPPDETEAAGGHNQESCHITDMTQAPSVLQVLCLVLETLCEQG